MERKPAKEQVTRGFAMADFHHLNTEKASTATRS
jgi:hypothetical protein